MANLIHLACRDDQGQLRIVVETPKGSPAKIKYDPELQVFELQRFLAGARYPYDWGFVPSTLAEDGDPLDAMVLFDGHTWPGVVIPAVGIGLLKLRESKADEAQPRRNDRVIAVPAARTRGHAPSQLATETRTLLEQFFVATGELANKRVSIEGWGDESEVTDAVQRAAAAYDAKQAKR